MVAPCPLEKPPIFVLTKTIKATADVVRPAMGEVRASRPVNSLPRDVAAPETRVNSHAISAVVNVLEIAAVAVAALVPTAVVLSNELTSLEVVQESKLPEDLFPLRTRSQCPFPT